MSPAPAPAVPSAPTAAFREGWLARYGSLSAAAAWARQREAGTQDERVALRMQLLLLRLERQGPDAAPRYHALAEDLRSAGDAAGALIARSFAIGAEGLGGDSAAALAEYHRLGAAIEQLDDALERHVALGPSLALYQAEGQVVAYMQQACRMLQLAQEVDHEGMRLAALCNLGIAFHQAGDDLQARGHLEHSLAGNHLGGWLRFCAVAILAEIYASSGELEQVLPLLRVWAFPERSEEFEGLSLMHFHVLGAEVHARLGRVQEARVYIEHVQAQPARLSSHDVRCMLALVRALCHQHEAETEAAAAELDSAVALAQTLALKGSALPPRFWWLAAGLASQLGRWEQAYRLLDRWRQLELHKVHDIMAVRRVAAQFHTEGSTRAVEAAQRDRLTGLGNRERLIAAGDGWAAAGHRPAVAMLNVRRFEAINQALGREIGDAVLQAVADRLRQACIRFEHALAGRVYADQFALVLAHGLRDIGALQGIATELFATPLEVAGQWVDIRTAWGVALSAQGTVSMHRLMSQAEIALHQDRRSDAGWTVYEDSMVRADVRQLSLISELQRAAQADEFVLMLQPKFRLADNAVAGFESLIRWQHPQRGLVPPGEFIPFAESTGSIKGITTWVLQRAMQMTVRLRSAALPSQIAVNVSVHDVATPGFRALLQTRLRETGARADDIRLELTEGAVMKDPATVIDQMREINALGFEWSVDDFGTGQSSLSYLHMLPVSELKIDRSFVRGAAESGTMLTLLKAAIDLGHNLGLSTVGEGAETAEEWALLRQLGCTTAQGWFGARPMAEAALLGWLQAREAAPPPG